MEAREAELSARVEQDAGDVEAFEALRQIYVDKGATTELSNLLEQHALRAPDVTLRARAACEAAGLLAGALGDVERAVKLLEDLLVSLPEHGEIATQLFALMPRTTEGNERLLRAFEARTKEVQRKSAANEIVSTTYSDLGELWERLFQIDDKALANYRQAIALDARNVRALYLARQILKRRIELPEAAKLFELEATAESTPSRKAALLVELGHLRMEGMGDIAGAVEAFERAHNLDPANPMGTRFLAYALACTADRSDPEEGERVRDVVASLYYDLALASGRDEALTYSEEALTASPAHEAALELLESLAEAANRKDLLPQRWVAYLERQPEGPFAGVRRRKLGHAYLESRQPMDAIACLEPLMERHDPEAAEMLVDLYRRVGRDDDAARALTTALAGLPPERRVPKLREVLHLRIDQGKTEEAFVSARQILALDAADEVALDLLSTQCRDAHDYAGLRDLLVAAVRAPNVPAELRKQHLKELAFLMQSALHDTDGATRAWEALLSIEPDADASSALETLHESAGRWDDLSRLLERVVSGTAEPSERARLYRKLARVEIEHRGNPHGGMRALRSYRALKPEDTAARDELAELLLSVGATVEAVGLLRARADEQPKGVDRTALLRRLAKILEHDVEDHESAYQIYAELVEDGATDDDALEAMIRLDERLANWPRLLETLAYRGEVAAKDDVRLSVYVRMAEISERELREFDRAADYYGQALVIDPENDSVLDALAHTYGRTSRHKDLVTVLYRQAKREPSPTARAKLHRRLARILQEELANPSAAMEAWEHVLTDEPTNEEALRQVVEHARRTAKHERLQTLLAVLAAIVETDVERVDLMVQRADVLTKKLDRKKEAIGVMRDVVDQVDATHLGALDWLATAYEDSGAYAELAATLERQISVIEDEPVRAPFARRLADVHLHRLDDPDKALTALDIWRKAQPRDPEPLRRMAPLLDRLKRWQDLRDVNDVLASLESKGASRQAQLRAAEITATLLGDADGAFRRIQPLAEGGDAEALVLMQRLERKESIAPDAAEVKLHRARAETDPRQRRVWLLDAARLFESAVRNPERTFEITREAFEIDPLDDMVLSLLERRAGAAGRLEDLPLLLDRTRRSLEAGLDSADTTEERVNALVGHARFAWGRMHNEMAFTSSIGLAVDAAVNQDELLEVIEQAVVSLDSVADHTPIETLVSELSRAADVAGHREEMPRRAELLRRAGRLLANQLGSPWEAIEVFKHATLADVGREAILEELEAICRRAGAIRELEQHLDTLAREAVDAGPATVALRHRAGLLTAIGRHSDAAEVFQQLWGMHPDDRSIPQKLAQCLRRTERHQELVGVLERMLETASNAAEKRTLLAEIARVWHDRLDNPWEAHRAWQEILRANADDPEARKALLRLQDDLHVPTDPEVARPTPPIPKFVRPDSKAPETKA